MTNKTVVPAELGVSREIGAQTRLFAAKKSELRIGWEGASRPEVLATLEAYDTREIDATADALLARFS